MEYQLGQTVNVTPIRKMIGSRLRESMDTAVQANHRVRADMSALKAARERYKAQSIDITIGDMVLKCVCEALAEFPLMNSTLQEKKILVQEDINLGVAVATEWGLIVPVVKQAQNLTIQTLSQQVKDLSQKAKNRILPADEMTGGTFTVSNLGMLGLESFTAVINPPEAGILAIGAIVDTVVPQNGGIAVKPLCELSLTYDHRILDGEPAARFLMLVKKKLEAF